MTYAKYTEQKIWCVSFVCHYICCCHFSVGKWTISDCFPFRACIYLKFIDINDSFCCSVWWAAGHSGHTLVFVLLVDNDDRELVFRCVFFVLYINTLTWTFIILEILKWLLDRSTFYAILLIILTNRHCSPNIVKNHYGQSLWQLTESGLTEKRAYSFSISKW